MRKPNPKYDTKDMNRAVNRNLLAGGPNLPYDPDLVPFARDLRKHATKEERMLWNYLKTLPVRVRRQRPIERYIVDFYIPSHKIVIEIDGGQHYSEIGKENDERRTRVLGEFGLHVLRYNNLEVRENISRVCVYIREALGL